MPKVNQIIPHEPQILLWGKPRALGSTAGDWRNTNIPEGDPRRAAGTSEDRIRKHPKVTWKCKFFEFNDSASRHPDNPDFSGPSGEVNGFYSILNYEERIARRIREHAQDQIALGWEPQFLHFFVQHFGVDGPSGGTPAMCRSEPDAAGIVGGGDGFNSIYTNISEQGPSGSWAPATRIPMAEASERIKNRLKVELQQNGIGPLGYWTNDMENLHQPWRWCLNHSGGGSWTSMLADPRSETEIICSGQHRITGQSISHTLKSWVEECRKNRAPSFSPFANQVISSDQNVNNGTTRELHVLRLDAAQSQFARVTTDIWKEDAFWENLKINNYNFFHVDNPKFPIHMSGGGTKSAEHTINYFGFDMSHFQNYAINTDRGDLIPAFKRFSPRQRFGVASEGPGLKKYDEVQLISAIRRYIGCHKMSSMSNLPLIVSVRGIDNNASGRVPALEVEDLVRAMKTWASYEKTEVILIWFEDGNPSRPNWDRMLSAIQQFYPQWVWNESLNDWINVNQLGNRERVEIRRLTGNFVVVPDEPIPITRP